MADKTIDTTLAIPALMEATLFAADKHRGCQQGQRSSSSPTRSRT